MPSAIPAPPPDASDTRRGLMNLVAQRFTGLKQFMTGVQFGDGTIQTTAAAAPDLSGYLPLTGGTLTGTLFGPTFQGATGASFTAKSSVADGTVNAFVFDTINSLSNVNAQLFSFRNQGVEKAYIYKDGTYFTTNGSLYALAHRGTGAWPGVAMVGGGAEPFNGATISSFGALSNAASKIVTFGTGFGSTGAGYTEKAYLDKDGGFVGPTVTLSGIAKALEYRANGTNSVLFKGFTGAGPGAVPEFIFDTTAAVYQYDLNTSWKANGTQVASVNNNGTFNSNGFQGGLVCDLGQWGQIQLRQSGNAPTAGKASFMNPYGAARFCGSPADGATALGLRLACDAALTVAGARIVDIANVDVVKAYFGKDGMLGFITGAGADVAGTATLVGGTVTVATTAIRAGSQIMLTRNTSGGTIGDLKAPAASIIAATSFVITSASGTDTSTVNWFIIDKN